MSLGLVEVGGGSGSTTVGGDIGMITDNSNL